MSENESTPAALANATRQSVDEVVVGGKPLHWDERPVVGAFTEVDGEPAYRIDHIDGLDPFFVTVVSDADHWLFASSTGSL